MGVLEVVLSAVVCAVVVLSVARIAMKAGYSPWWAVVPAAVAAVSFATLATVHGHARFGALSLHTVVHSARALAIADAACLGVTVLLLVVFAVSDWPVLAVRAPAAVAATATAAASTTTPGTTSSTATSKAHRRRRASARAQAQAAAAAAVPARMRIRALPDVAGQPAGWFASGALGSGEQSYWDGTQWTARRCWRNEMWINQPLEPSLLAQPMR
jgi:hypothetical protein